LPCPKPNCSGGCGGSRTNPTGTTCGWCSPTGSTSRATSAANGSAFNVEGRTFRPIIPTRRPWPHEKRNWPGVPSAVGWSLGFRISATGDSSPLQPGRGRQNSIRRCPLRPLGPGVSSISTVRVRHCSMPPVPSRRQARIRVGRDALRFAGDRRGAVCSPSNGYARPAGTTRPMRLGRRFR